MALYRNECCCSVKNQSPTWTPLVRSSNILLKGKPVVTSRALQTLGLSNLLTARSTQPRRPWCGSSVIYFGRLTMGLPSFLLSLDISAVFDTLDHKQLLEQAQSLFGLSDTVLDWIGSCLSDRQQHVSILPSPSVKPTQYVPQGSVLGPPLFSIITHLLVISSAASESHIIKMLMTFSCTHYQCHCHLYHSSLLSCISSVSSSPASLLSAIHHWSGTRLQLSRAHTQACSASVD